MITQSGEKNKWKMNSYTELVQKFSDFDKQGIKNSRNASNKPTCIECIASRLVYIAIYS